MLRLRLLSLPAAHACADAARPVTSDRPAITSGCTAYARGGMRSAGLSRRRVRARERVFGALLGAMVAAWQHVAGAQGATSAAQRHCDELPAGPDRTDCYIALSWMSRQQFEIAAGMAQQTKDMARLHRVTGGGHKIKAPAAKRRY